jgi:hypothetical protein
LPGVHKVVIRSAFVLIAYIGLASVMGRATQSPSIHNVRYPWVYPGDFNERVRRADLVISGTIASTDADMTRIVDRVDVTANKATIQIDRVFKGQALQRVLKFVWFSPAPVSGGIVYSGPPLANFAAGKRYLVFLGRDTSGYVVIMPIYQLEVPLAPAAAVRLSDVSPLPDKVRDSEIAQELETAALSFVPPAAGVTGEAATYFSYVVDLIGGCAEPFLEHFATSPNKALAGAAQRWLTLLADRHMRCESGTYHER